MGFSSVFQLVTLDLLKDVGTPLSLDKYMEIIIPTIIAGVILSLLNFVFNIIRGKKEKHYLKLKHTTEIMESINSNREFLDRAQELIVIDVNKADDYPDYNKTGKKSSWFKVEYYRSGPVHGIELITNILHFDYDHKNDTFTKIDRVEESDDTVKLFELGLIPLHSIVHIDWNADEYEGLPRFYVKYSRKNGPWGSFKYCKREMSNGRQYFMEVRSRVVVKHKSGYAFSSASVMVVV